jgi:hypothetical protein
MASILPKGKTQFLNLLGRPLVGGKVYFYLPDTETKKDTWQDPEMTIPNTNPIVLDARGEAVIWGEGSYRQVVKDVLGITIWDQETSSSVSDIALSGPGGSALVGTPDGSTIADQFRTRLNRVVDSIAELRALDHAESTRAFVTGYYEASDGGGGAYQYDPDDASSLDNGVTVIVATDGARWKLQYHNVLSLEPESDERRLGARRRHRVRPQVILHSVWFYRSVERQSDRSARESRRRNVGRHRRFL